MAEPGGPQAAVFAPTERYLGLYQKLMEKHGLTFDIWLQSGYCAFVSINHPWSGKAAVSVEDIEDGTYGYCEDTGEPIGLGRLEARPTATLSVEAQERHERRERVHRDD